MPTKKQRRASSAKTPSRQRLTAEERAAAEAKIPSADRAAFEQVMRGLIAMPPPEKKQKSKPKPRAGPPS